MDEPKSAGYIRALRRWTGLLFHEPNSLLAGSLWFLLTALPVVTIGPAWLALLDFMAAREAGKRRTWRQSCRLVFFSCGRRVWLMSASDALALLMAGGCLLAVTDGAFLLPLRAVYAMLFAVDALYLLSGLYRYPALRAEAESRAETELRAEEAGRIADTASASMAAASSADNGLVSKIVQDTASTRGANRHTGGLVRDAALLALRGALLALGNLGWTLMFFFASLLALLVSGLTGVGVLLLFPAASAALAVCAYEEMIAYYLPEGQEAQERGNQNQEGREPC
ncbi:MAG: hypothetical protein LBU58_08745 [Clostridiales bacterium]|jgi:hypothetical protein|nr:hypothetical protein [Clostridiales bacterium]